jgi:lipid A 3-O-deacylase
MKIITLFFLTIFLMMHAPVMSAEKGRSLLEKLLRKDLPGGASSKSKKESPSKSTKTEKINSLSCSKKGGRSLLEKALGRDLPGGNSSKGLKEKCTSSKKQVKIKKNTSRSFFNNDDHTQNISLYTGTFDTIDKEGDEKTSLVGIEHKNKNLFRDTWLGTFSPTTGGFVTKKSSVYLYTGVEADYNLGPINISPSFAPGYYEAGDGKNLGSALEFKSEIKIGVDLFKNSNLGYSYSHISNNDWGDVNPGTDNQSVTFSKKF